jgi:tRNA(Ile)-lysidine synthase
MKARGLEMKGRHRIPLNVMGRVEQTIRAHDLLRRGDRIVAAVSGGPDSVALLRILHHMREAWDWELAVAHLHHGIRGEDADEDLAFVARMAEELALPFFHRRLLSGALKAMGGSLQEAARRIRYAFMEEVRSQWGGQKIALGHQADDQVETILAALLRGAGTRGLSGMPYQRGMLVRPLLDLHRQEIVRFLEARAAPFREDSSNRDPGYRRNRIRHELLPLLRDRFNPGIDELLRQTGRACAADEAFLKESLAARWSEAVLCGQERVEIPIALYSTLPLAIRWRLIRRAYQHLRGEARGLGLVHLEAVDGLVSPRGEERWVHLPGGVHAAVGGGNIVLGWAAAMAPGSFQYPVSVPGETRVPEADLAIGWDVVEAPPSESRGDGRERVSMDLDAVCGPMALRGPRSGDRIRPLGLGGTRKVQDILVDGRVPRRDRWRVPLLVDQMGILWVVGHRMDERARLHPGTRRILVGRVTHCPDSALARRR